MQLSLIIFFRLLLSTSKLQDPNGNTKILPTNLWSQNTYTTEEEKRLNPDGIQIDYILFRVNENYDVSASTTFFSTTNNN